MGTNIRPMLDDEVDTIVEFAVRAWGPVFVSIRETLGPRLFTSFFGDDWTVHQANDIRRACTEYQTLVADDAGRAVGFTSIDLREGEEGEIYMVAVDPDTQGGGIGTALTNAAVEVIRAAGKKYAIVNTGADPGHAPARATYRKAGFTAWPSEQFYLLLDDA